MERVRDAQERLFPERLDPAHPRRLLSARRSWQYRPSHHVSRGLLRASDLAELSLPGRRLLSVGAHPAVFEELLCALGLPPANLVVADRDPAIADAGGEMQKVVFDMFDPWPALGRFDLILFPESLCIALADRVAAEPPDPDVASPDTGGAPAGPFAKDHVAGRLLAQVLGQALDRLRPGAELRADGPQSHPNVVRAASAVLDAAGRPHHVDYDRFFLRVRATDPPSGIRFT